jgi:hypothetical protein
VLGMTQGGEAEQRMHGGKAGVAGAHAVVPLRLEVVEERADERRVEVGEVELARGLAGAGVGEGQEQPERVP